MPEETNIAYVTAVLVTLLTSKFQQIVRSWYSVQVTFVCTALWSIYLRSNLPNLFEIRRVFQFYESYGETHFGVFFMPHRVDGCIVCNEHNTVFVSKRSTICASCLLPAFNDA